MNFLNEIKPRKFEWNFRHTDVDKGKESSGFIAQEILETVEKYDAHYTNLVDTNNSEQYTFSLSALIPIIVNSIKELNEENKKLKERIEILDSKMTQ